MNSDLAQLKSELDKIASTVSLPAGSILFHCGDPVSGVFLVRSGQVRMTLDSADGIFHPRTVGAGEILGLPAALTGHYSLTAQVAEDAEFGYIPAPRVTALFECAPHLCLLATRLMSDEIARMRAALRDGVRLAPPSA